MEAIAHVLKLQGAAETSRQGKARHALVVATDPTNHSVKVAIQPENVVSGWIPDPGLACAGLQIACPSEIGTQVLVVPLEGDAEHPVIVCRLFDTTMRPPLSPVTGEPVQPGEFGIFLQGGNYLHLTASTIAIRGNVTIDGTLKTTGDVVAKSVSVAGHRHDGVSAGSGISGTPVAGA
jgi:phage baseplate assembly protein gpV